MKIPLFPAWLRSPSKRSVSFPPRLSVLIDTRDMWVGLYWTRDDRHQLHLYICPIPCLVIHWRRINEN